ncbi:putative transcriptional regulator with C-terminal CBS domains [Thiovulum sp. ES]|nr:putative transcriptional regulator with C-terminal CBS domains [Thiovulum sp. ES]
MENREENLVKKTCRELGITQKELAEKTGISLPTINRWSASNQIPKQNIIFLETILENQKLQNKLLEFQDFFEKFKTLSSF